MCSYASLRGSAIMFNSQIKQVFVPEIKLKSAKSDDKNYESLPSIWMEILVGSVRQNLMVLQWFCDR